MDKLKQFKIAMKLYVEAHRQWIVAGLSLCVIALLLLCFYLGQRNTNWKADEVLTRLFEVHPDLAVLEIDESESEDLALDAISSKAYFSDVVLKLDQQDFAGCIEVYANHQEALLRKQYLEAFADEKITLMNEKDFGSFIAKDIEKEKEHLYVNGNILLRLNGQYSLYQANKIINEVSEILKEREQKEKNLPSPEEIAARKEQNIKRAKEDALKAKETLEKSFVGNMELWKTEAQTADIYGLINLLERVNQYESIPSLTSQVEQLRDFIQGKIDSISKEINDALDLAEENLDQKALDDVKTKITSLNHEIFDTYKIEWDTRIGDIQWKIDNKAMQDYKDACQSFDYDDLINNNDKYIGVQVYFRGKVDSISHTIDGTILEITIKPVSFLSMPIYWENTLCVVLEKENAAVIETGNIVNVWGVIEGMTNTSTWFGTEQEVPLMKAKYIEKER